jgi:hypothetical protein
VNASSVTQQSRCVKTSLQPISAHQELLRHFRSLVQADVESENETVSSVGHALELLLRDEAAEIAELMGADDLYPSVLLGVVGDFVNEAYRIVLGKTRRAARRLIGMTFEAMRTDLHARIARARETLGEAIVPVLTSESAMAEALSIARTAKIAAIVPDWRNEPGDSDERCFRLAVIHRIEVDSEGNPSDVCDALVRLAGIEDESDDRGLASDISMALNRWRLAWDAAFERSRNVENARLYEAARRDLDESTDS